jgi:hypothetical protein
MLDPSWPGTSTTDPSRPPTSTLRPSRALLVAVYSPAKGPLRRAWGPTNATQVIVPGPLKSASRSTLVTRARYCCSAASVVEWKVQKIRWLEPSVRSGSARENRFSLGRPSALRQSKKTSEPSNEGVNFARRAHRCLAEMFELSRQHKPQHQFFRPPDAGSRTDVINIRRDFKHRRDARD